MSKLLPIPSRTLSQIAVRFHGAADRMGQPPKRKIQPPISILDASAAVHIGRRADCAGNRFDLRVLAI
jgi:hypothetical protein